MGGYIPLAVEATIERLAATAATCGWVWISDTALAVNRLLVWRDHDPAVRLAALPGGYDPDALVWAISRNATAPPAVAELAELTAVRVAVGPVVMSAELQRLPGRPDPHVWAAATSSWRLHGQPPQQVASRDHTIDRVLAGWLDGDHTLTATIDALTIAHQLPTDQLIARMRQLFGGDATGLAAERLTLLDATPHSHLDLHVKPDHAAALRATAHQLDTLLRGRAVSR